MKLYFIVSSDDDVPSKDLLSELKDVGEVVVIRHKGPLSKLGQLKKDEDEKVLAVDPGVFDWDLDAETIKEIPNVKAICTSSTSFDWINQNY